MSIALGYLSDLPYRLFFEEEGTAHADAENRTEEAEPGTGALSGSGA